MVSEWEIIRMRKSELSYEYNSNASLAVRRRVDGFLYCAWTPFYERDFHSDLEGRVIQFLKDMPAPFIKGNYPLPTDISEILEKK